MTAVAGTKFTNPDEVWLSQTFVYGLIFITAESRGVWLGKVSLAIYVYVLDTLSLGFKVKPRDLTLVYRDLHV